MKRLILFVGLWLWSFGIIAQLAPARHLNKLITVNISNQRLEQVLAKISKEGDFIFSYSGSVLNKDSLVSVNVQRITLRDLLDKLFRGKVDYKESGKYIILRSTVRRFSIVPQVITTGSNSYFIDGHIIDINSGAKVKDASVYEKHLLQSTLSDDEGYFKLQFKGNNQSIILTASKDTYRDTSMLFLSSVKISPTGYLSNDGETINPASNRVERFRLSRFLISSRQRIQSLNIPDFIANSPFQASLLPGISSHGMLSSQVVNKGSLNVLGGYTAGVNGLEIAGIFNINKQDMRKVQVGGVFNLVGGQVIGVQVAGVMNTVLDSVKGVQVGGVVNDVRDKMEGVQVAGVINRTGRDFKGTQVAGVSNLSRNVMGVQVAGVANTATRSVKGTQVAGLGNIVAKNLTGTQVSGVFNYAKRMDGVQIGLINLADTSSGYSIGLINLVRKGYHKISVYSTEVMNLNAGIKTGNDKLYSIILGGLNVSDTEKIISAGFGMGHEFRDAKRLGIETEISSQFLHLGNWDQANILNRGQLSFQYKILKYLRIFGGPAFSVYYSNSNGRSSIGYKTRIIPAYASKYSSSLHSWLGWSVGITLF
ncbi:MAG: STN domain-containing protein [Sphingobacteriaceae bacterium]|nr:STN domain-containing protein [Sphingobacteriaceae bacterium]